MDRANPHTKSYDILRSFEAMYINIKIRTKSLGDLCMTMVQQNGIYSMAKCHGCTLVITGLKFYRRSLNLSRVGVRL